MVFPIKRFLKQTATYWPVISDADQFGRPVYGDPVEIRCRWDETCEEFIDSRGSKQMSRAKIVTDTAVVAGGKLMLGTESYAVMDDAVEIKSANGVPDLYGNRVVWNVFV